MMYRKHHDLILDILQDKEIISGQLREFFNTKFWWGWQWTESAFHLLMKEMEDCGKIICRYEYRKSEIWPCVRYYSIRKEA